MVDRWSRQRLVRAPRRWWAGARPAEGAEARRRRL